MKPHLLIDAHQPGGSGLGRYTFEILRGLAARSDFATIHLAGPKQAMEAWRDALRDSPTPLRVIPFDVSRHSPTIPMKWRGVARAVGTAHVTWFPHWDGAWSIPRAVTTIHDLIHLEGKGARAAVRRTVVRTWIGQMIRSSAHLITGSAGSAEAIIRAFPEAEGKLRVVHHGVNAAFFADTAPTLEPALASSRGVPSAAYLLTVANKREHKRLDTAIKAFASLANAQPALRLVMVGNRDSHYPALRALAESLGVANRVDDLEGIDDQTLAALYRNARALLVPSRTEGFGLVVLEAMASGTPVIAADRPPLPEVVGEAGIIVPYDDAAAMAAAIQTLNEVTRASLAAKGKARAAAFTWQRAADQVAELLLASSAK